MNYTKLSDEELALTTRKVVDAISEERKSQWSNGQSRNEEELRQLRMEARRRFNGK